MAGSLHSQLEAVFSASVFCELMVDFLLTCP